MTDLDARVAPEATHDPDSHPTTVWRVQWFSRGDLDRPEHAQGRQDFTDEAEARAWFTSDETQALVGPFWRVELQRREPWKTVEAGEYAAEEKG